MKIKIDRESFLKVFQLAAAVAPNRSPKEILMNVKLDAGKESYLTATDTEVSVRLAVPNVTVESAGSAILPVTRMNSILRESTCETLEIEVDDSKIIVSGPSSHFELQGQNPDEFPEVNRFDSKNYYEVNASVLKDLIRRTLFATDTESSRYALGGVKLELEGDTIIAVGTDGRRLAKMEGQMTTVGSPTDNGSTIVPSKSMQLIERMLPDDETAIKVAAQSNDLMIEEPGGVFYTRLVEGRFPPWREVLPKRDQTNLIEIPAGPLYSAIRQAAIVASDESRGIDFTFKEGTLELSSSTAEVGQSKVEMPVPFSGDEVSITLDHRFVADFLKVLDADQVFTFDIENSEAAAYCSTPDKYGYVIMPLSKDRR
ncbi:MAG: DNA polymerase III subunit beta [Planctomycetota bacterium]